MKYTVLKSTPQCPKCKKSVFECKCVMRNPDEIDELSTDNH